MSSDSPPIALTSASAVLAALQEIAEQDLAPSDLSARYTSIETAAHHLVVEADFQRAYELFTTIVERGIPEELLDEFWLAVWAVMAVSIATHTIWLMLPFARRTLQFCKTHDVPKIHLRKANTCIAIAYIENNLPVDSVIANLEAKRLAHELGDSNTEAMTSSNTMVALMQLGMFAEGAAIGNEVVARYWDHLPETETKPFRSTLLVNLAQCEFRRQRYEPALRAARKALDLYPTPTTLYGRVRHLMRYGVVAQALACLGRHAEAMEIVADMEGLAYDEERSVMLLAESRGVVLGRAGRHAEAIQTLEEAIKRFGSAGRVLELRCLLAVTYEAAGRFEDARRTYSDLATNSGASRAREMLASLRDIHPSMPAEATPYEQLKAHADERARATDYFEAVTRPLQRLADMTLLSIDPSGARAHRVGRLASLLLRETGAQPQECAWLETAAKLIDVGYAELPLNIITQPFPLTPVERELVRRHPESGALLVGSDTPELARAAELIRTHHERWDGQGYPRGLSGDDIPVVARVVALADSFDALTHARPWRPAFGFNESLQILEDGGGTQYDPLLAPVFTRMLAQLSRKHSNLGDFLAEGAAGTPAVTMRTRILSSLRVDATMAAAAGSEADWHGNPSAS